MQKQEKSDKFSASKTACAKFAPGNQGCLFFHDCKAADPIQTG